MFPVAGLSILMSQTERFTAYLEAPRLYSSVDRCPQVTINLLLQATSQKIRNSSGLRVAEDAEERCRLSVDSPGYLSTSFDSFDIGVNG
jgi:hypothetical protein